VAKDLPDVDYDLPYEEMKREHIAVLLILRALLARFQAALPFMDHTGPVWSFYADFKVELETALSSTSMDTVRRYQEHMLSLAMAKQAADQMCDTWKAEAQRQAKSQIYDGTAAYVATQQLEVMSVKLATVSSELAAITYKYEKLLREKGGS
jgi:hypothetical protein